MVAIADRLEEIAWADSEAEETLYADDRLDVSDCESDVLAIADKLEETAWADSEAEDILYTDDRLDASAWESDALAEGGREESADRLVDKAAEDA